MILNLLWLALGIPLLLFGGDALVRGSASLARHIGVSPLVIGLTIVAFGTSAPELAVNLTAALRGDAGISFGNIVGSNIANIGLILGICALITPLAVHRTIIIREIPMMLLATLAVVVMAYDHLLGDTASLHEGDFLSRSDGVIMLLFFGVFMYYTLADAFSQRNNTLPLVPDVNEVEQQTHTTLGLSWLLLAGGLIGVILGGRLTVVGAAGIAETLGVPQEVIGLSIVAVGTSLPELATGVMAVRRNQTDIAIGNVVGSNIFNLLLILAITSIVSPLQVPPGGQIDLWVMAALSLALLPLAISGRRKVDRYEGIALLLIYTGYIGWRGADAFGLFGD